MGDAAERARDAEVDQLHRALERDQDVLRRDVAVHDAQRPAVAVGERVRVAEPARRLGDDVAASAGLGGRRSRAALRSTADSGLPCTSSIDEEVLLAVVADLDDAHDVRVIEQRREPRLVEEHPE